MITKIIKFLFKHKNLAILALPYILPIFKKVLISRSRTFK